MAAEETFIKRAAADVDELTTSVRARLTAAQNSHFTSDEIKRVSALWRPLFPAGFQLSSEATESFRVLAKFSQTDLRPASSITSHRRFIGPVIVALKKLSWPLIKLHLRETLAGIKEYNSRMLIIAAKQHVELERLRSNSE